MDCKDFVDREVQRIQDEVGPQGQAIVALSGGIDSTVAGVLAHQALGDRFFPVFLDTGLMRENEPQSVVGMFRSLDIEVQVVEAADLFFDAFEGLSEKDPDKGMRLIFSRTFYTVLGKLGQDCNCNALLQGTNEIDIKETRAGIKKQHNVDINPEEYGFQKIVEPLDTLDKSQIRELGCFLGLPDKVIWRQPFPGPGLATRCYPPITRERIATTRQATVYTEKVIEESGLEPVPFQYFAVLMGDKACGKIDGQRVWGNVICVRCVISEDAVTAQAYPLAPQILQNICQRIVDNMPSVTRVTYDLSNKGAEGSATIELL